MFLRSIELPPISAAAFILGPLYRMEKEAGGKSVIRHVFKNSMLGRGEKAEFAQSELRHEARWVQLGVIHLPQDLGWVDLDFGSSTVWLMGIWQKWLCSWAKWWNTQIKINPTQVLGQMNQFFPT